MVINKPRVAATLRLRNINGAAEIDFVAHAARSKERSIYSDAGDFFDYNDSSNNHARMDDRSNLRNTRIVLVSGAFGALRRTNARAIFGKLFAVAGCREMQSLHL
jgi:hypothetical protein